MKRESLKYLSKSDMMDIIMSEPTTERRAFYKVAELVHNKIQAIIEEQGKCDLMTYNGRIQYAQLEKEYIKWSKIQENL